MNKSRVPVAPGHSRAAQELGGGRLTPARRDNWVKYRLNDGGFEFVNGQPPEEATPAQNFTRWNRGRNDSNDGRRLRYGHARNFGGRIAA